MTNGHPEGREKGTPKKFLYGRSLGPLLGPWIACTLIAAGVFIFETQMPVFHEVVKLIYFIIAVILVVATGRWFRIRHTRRRQGEQGDRRHGERRQSKSDS